MGLPDLVQNNPIVFFLGSLITGFIAGFGAYGAILRISQRETVAKDSYILKKDLMGNLIKSEAIKQISHLIEVGTSINAETNPEKVEVYFMKVTTFLHYLDLPKEVKFIGDKMSLAEQDVRMIVQGNPSMGHTNLTTKQKLERVVGILQGLQAGFQPQSGT